MDQLEIVSRAGTTVTPNKNIASIASYDSRLRNDPGKTTLNLCLIWMRSNEKAEFVRRHKS